MILRRTFRAMGTDCEWIVDTDDPSRAFAVFAEAERDIARREAEWSRFAVDSALSRLNRDGMVTASREMAEIVGRSLLLRDETDGLFDPTLHDAIVSAGYDRSFDDVVSDGEAGSCAPPSAGGAVYVDVDSGTIRLGPNVRIDLGGIAKGYAADRAADVLSEAGPCVVNLGGEVAVRGARWPIGIETDGVPLVVELESGVVATSGVDRRRWVNGHRARHHIIDPATGDSAATDLRRVAVVASDGARADALATALLVAGRERALAMAESLDVAVVLQTPEGVIDTRKVLR